MKNMRRNSSRNGFVSLLFLSNLMLSAGFTSGCSSTKKLTLESESMSELKDPYLWLEEVDSKNSMDWVKSKSTKTESELMKHPSFSKTESEIRKIVLAKDRIPMPMLIGNQVYNFWQDAVHVRGLFRRTSLESYLAKGREIQWENVLDLDDLSKVESKNWVWKGLECLTPSEELCLLALSDGGKDAVIYREFNLKTRQFIKDGFITPEAKTSVSWLSENELLIASDFGPGTMTESGYARTIRLWKRGQDLFRAKVVFEGKSTDMATGASVYDLEKSKGVQFVLRSSFFKAKYYEYDPVQDQTSLIHLPEHAEVHGVLKDGRMVVSLREDSMLLGTNYPSGSLISFSPKTQTIVPLYLPKNRKSLSDVQVFSDFIYIHFLNQVKSELVRMNPESNDPKSNWNESNVDLPKDGVIHAISTSSTKDRAFYSFENFLTPPSVYFIDTKKNQVQIAKSIPKRFDATGMKIHQYESKSKDGTSIPYFLVTPKNFKWDSKTPTVLYGYGGFEVPMLPNYLGATGKVWLESGGAYVLANLRGGGEFGPQWHQAVMKENRQKVFDDFISIAEDLIQRKATSAQHLGIHGGSNGGLLVGATFIQRPDLFQAVACEVPLLDMLRYSKLLAGASWMEEYGDPSDPKIRESIIKYSPYQNIKLGMKYPEILLMTSTRDDRVHPGHARKMAARLEEYGYPFYYFENTEGGHAGAANLEQRIKMASLRMTYFKKKLF